MAEIQRDDRAGGVMADNSDSNDTINGSGETEPEAISDNISGTETQAATTRRIDQIAELAASGRTDKEIAASLGISSHTVSTYWKRLRATTGTKNRTAAVLALLRERLEQQNQELRATHDALRQAHESSRDGMAGLIVETQRRLATAQAGARDTGHYDTSMRLARVIAYELSSLEPVVYSFVSPSADAFGHDAAAMRSGVTSFYDLPHPDDIPQIMEKSLGASYAPNERYIFVYRLRTPAGPRWILDTHQALYGPESGRLARVPGLVIDIHDLVEAGMIPAQVARLAVPAPPL